MERTLLVHKLTTIITQHQIRGAEIRYAAPEVAKSCGLIPANLAIVHYGEHSRN